MLCIAAWPNDVEGQPCNTLDNHTIISSLKSLLFQIHSRMPTTEPRLHDKLEPFYLELSRLLYFTLCIKIP